MASEPQISAARTVAIRPAESFLRTIHPVHIAFFVVPVNRDISVPAVVLRVLTFDRNSADKTQDFTYVPDMHAWYSESVESGGRTGEATPDNLKPGQFIQLRPDLTWETFQNLSRDDDLSQVDDLSRDDNLSRDGGTSQVFNDSGIARQFGLAATIDDSSKSCVILGPLKHKHGVRVSTRFVLQACVVSEGTKESSSLGERNEDNSILNAYVEFAAGENVELWLHASETGDYSLTPLPEPGHPAVEDVPVLNNSEEPLVHEVDVTAFEGDDSSPVDDSHLPEFVQAVEFGDKEISHAQVERIVLQVLARSELQFEV